MKILGLDVGDKRIGMAVSSDDNIFAYGVAVIERKNINYDLEELKKIVQQYAAKAIVVGMPYHTCSNRETFQSKKIKDFAKCIKKSLAIPVYYQDERFTTKESLRVLAQAGLKENKTKKIKDKISAQLILQTFLDKNEL